MKRHTKLPTSRKFSKAYLLIFIAIFAAIGVAVLLKSSAASTWSNPVQVSSGSGSPYFALAASGDTLYMARGDNGGTTITLRRSTDQGATWGSSSTVASGYLYYDRPLVVDGQNIYIFYIRNIRTITDWCCSRDMGDIFMKRSTDGGATWKPEIQLTTAKSAYRVAGQTQGSNIYLAWMDYRTNSTWDLYYRRSTDSGATWGTETLLAKGTNGFGAERPDIVANGNVVHLFWNDVRDNSPSCATAPQCVDIYYKRSTDSGATWGADVRLTSDPEWSGRPMAAISGSNNVIVTWEQQIPGDDADSNEAYVMRSIDNGITWQLPQRLSFAVGDSSHNFAAANATGVFVAWHDGRFGQDEIFFRQSPDNGATWQPEERITNNSGNSDAPFVAVTSGYVHVMWGDDTSGSDQVYYSREALSQTNPPPPPPTPPPPAPPPPPPPPKTGDLNSDGRVDIADLSILLANWNTTNATSDINKDGTVNIFDLSILLSKFGS